VYLQIKVFNIIPDALGAAKSKTAVYEYEDSGATDSAIQGLNGISLGDFKLTVTRVPQSMVNLLLKPVTNDAVLGSSLLLKMPPTCALQLSNMVTDEDLRDDELFAELLEDVGDECNNYGTVRSIIIPRPVDAATDSNHYSARDNSAGKLNYLIQSQ
jgi:splicing factor U2AF subunit